MNFKFIGKFSFGDNLITDGTSKSGVAYKRLNASVNQGDSNRAYIEAFGQDVEGKELTVIGKDNKKMTIDSADRMKEDVVANVASYTKMKFKIGDNDYEEFVCPYDALDYLQQNSTELKGQKVIAKGDVKREYYNGSVRNKFNLKELYFAKDDVREILDLNAVIYFTKDSFDFPSYKKEKKMNVNAYTKEYMHIGNNGNKKVYEERFVPHQFVLDHTKVNFDNEDHVRMVKAQFASLMIDPAKGFIGNSKSVYSVEMNIKYVNGTEEIEFNETMLTPYQKIQIEGGFHTIDDYRPKNGVAGEKVESYRLKCATTNPKYANGPIEEDFNTKEFADRIYTPPVDEQPVETKAASEKNNELFDDLAEDLFA